MSRLSDDEKRYFTDQISMLKNENERLTKYVEYSKDDKECMQNEIDVLRAWCLISNLGDSIRIQLSDDGEEETGWRKCVEAPTLKEAIDKAEELVNSVNAYEYGRGRGFSSPQVIPQSELGKGGKRPLVDRPDSFY